MGHFRCPYCWCQAQDLHALRGFHQWLQQQPPGSLNRARENGRLWMTPIQCLNYTELGLNSQESQSGTSTSCWWQAITRGILDFSCCRPTGSQHHRELADPERHEHMLGDKDGALKELKVEGVRQVLPKCTYLQDGMIFFMCFAFRMWFVAFNSPLIF